MRRGTRGTAIPSTTGGFRSPALPAGWVTEGWAVPIEVAEIGACGLSVTIDD